MHSELSTPHKDHAVGDVGKMDWAVDLAAENYGIADVLESQAR